MHVRTATLEDAAGIAAIYNPHVLHSTATFELDAVSVTEMARRIDEVQSRGLPWRVAVDETGALLGYAYAVPWKARAAYAHTVESSVYLREHVRGQGMGRRLYAELLIQLETRGLHAVIAGIALPNVASVALHERLGFAHVGTFRQVGHKFGQWVDVGYWQRLR